MNDTDRELLDRVRALHATLTQRTVLLSHVQSDVDIFAEGMRDLGADLTSVGDALLGRVRELDATPVATSGADSSALVARLAGQLADIGRP
ncbi:hypothetical protein [Amycolatopsis sp. CA-230715]|uniref:hypothetical protein n=1 Tax=Amycolatopsis sp. CA-230715 TaxID=2745196 RepID=UPI001C02B18A|nr:hypothetical protein [Amycolatopsis sp. CA-230715]QWF78226.1 hypothetical protein HUW46_01621 [Amycolatopsis sp. CA-230715]